MTRTAYLYDEQGAEITRNNYSYSYGWCRDHAVTFLDGDYAVDDLVTLRGPYGVLTTYTVADADDRRILLQRV